MPLISIIIPAYNAEAYLQRCLDSILSQSYSNYEVICIDDGSTDSTPALLAQYPSVKVITQTNHGMATARNHGLDKATGEYVMFVDSDDRLSPNALATLAPHLGGEDIVGFGTKTFNESSGTYTDNTITPTAVTTGWDYFNSHRLEPRPVHFVCIWQRVYRRAFLEEHNLHFADGLRRAEDDLFTTLAMLHVQSVKTIADCLYTYHLRPGSITRTVDPKLEADSRQVQQILADTFIPLEGINKHVIYQVLASNYITRLMSKGATLTDTEWTQFRQVCVTPRHRRLYRIARTSPALLRFYNKLCSSLR
jgi:glycosyltransferase involved in cell wall biosynthesis